jgi:hypothetical protein
MPDDKARKNVLILHSYHIPLEEYARDVALDVKKLQINGVIVKKSPKKRIFESLSRMYNAGWILDLHSDPQHREPPKERLISQYHPLALVEYGERWKGVYEGQETSEGKWVKNLLESFRENNYPGYVGGNASLEIMPWLKTRSNPRFIRIGLLWYRPRKISVEFIEKLSQYLQSYPL